MNKITCIILSGLLLTACNQSTEQTLSNTTIQQLSGAWANSNTESIRFYLDETAKIEMPNHNPPIKFISPFQGIKKDMIGIASGGFWSSPVLIETSNIANDMITVTLPDEKPFQLHKRPQ